MGLICDCGLTVGCEKCNPNFSPEINTREQAEMIQNNLNFSAIQAMNEKLDRIIYLLEVLCGNIA